MAMLAGVACVGVLVSLGVHTARAADGGRRYEMVSPADKNGGDVTGELTTVDAAADGNAIAYLARGSFGDTVGAGVVGQTQYVARRGPSGWTSLGVTPTPSPEVVMGLLFNTALFNFSDDVRRAVVVAFDLPAVTGDVRAGNFYVEDTLTRELRLVSIPPAAPFDFFTFLNDFLLPVAGGVSRDSRHIAFKAFSRLLPEAPDGVPSVYEWDDGTLRLASILPNGEIAPQGAMLFPEEYRGTVSPDGSRVLFVSPPTPEGQLYARIDHERTAWVSQPETRGVPPTPENVILQQVTGDSRHVLFTTTSRLLDEDTNDGSDLYLYTDSANPERDSNLTLLTNTGDVAGHVGAGTAVVGSSDDGRRVYFSKGGQMLLWENGALRVVARDVIPGPSPELNPSATKSSPGGGRVTPDGAYVAFVSVGVVSDGSGDPINGSGGLRQIYLYEEENDTLRCVSCPVNGDVASATASVIPDVTQIFPRASLPGLRPSFLALDGAVFFSTTAALVPGDTNGVTDVYEFDPARGVPSLVSTGKGSEPAAFADASATGDDVFFVTRQRLVKGDRDTLVDLYDARVGGGFPESPEPTVPCAGDVCQGAPDASPGDLTPGSQAFDGSGSAEAARLRILRFRALSRARGRLNLELSAPGTVRWTGRAVRRGSRSFAKAGTQRISLALKPAARRRLAERGAVRVTLRLVFAPVGGTPSTQTASLTFKGSSSKKGR